MFFGLGLRTAFSEQQGSAVFGGRRLVYSPLYPFMLKRSFLQPGVASLPFLLLVVIEGWDSADGLHVQLDHTVHLGKDQLLVRASFGKRLVH